MGMLIDDCEARGDQIQGIAIFLTIIAKVKVEVGPMYDSVRWGVPDGEGTNPRLSV